MEKGAAAEQGKSSKQQAPAAAWNVESPPGQGVALGGGQVLGIASKFNLTKGSDLGRKRKNQMLTVDTTFLIEEVGVITGTAVPEARQDTAISHLYGAGHSQIRQDH